MPTLTLVPTYPKGTHADYSIDTETGSETAPAILKISLWQTTQSLRLANTAHHLPRFTGAN